MDVRCIQIDERSIAAALSSAATRQGEFGAFHYRNLVASWPAPRYGLEKVEDVQKFAKANPDIEVQVDAALEFIAYLHELRHFHDCFGTTAGLSLFGAHLHHMRDFLRVTRDLARSKLLWQLPVTEWARKPSCPQFVKEFMQRHKEYSRVERLFMGGFVTHSEPGFSDEVWVDGFFPQYRLTIPLYPLMMKQGWKRGPEITMKQDSASTMWYAVGFEAITEGIAQAIQRSYLGSMWSHEVAERAWARMTFAVEGELLAQYNVTDFLISKLLKKRRGMDYFPRDVVLQASDAALMESAIDNRAGAPRRHPGEAFTHVLKTTDWDAPIERCPRTHLFGKEDVSRLIEALEKTARPHEIPIDAPDPFAGVESWVHHEVALPLLRKRMSHGNECFYDMERYIPIAHELPLPPLRIVGGDLSGEIDNRMFTHWAHYMMVCDIAEQILSGHEIITCPRYSATVAGMAHGNLCVENSGHCEEHRAWRRCGRWFRGRPPQVPKCLFSMVLPRLKIT